MHHQCAARGKKSGVVSEYPVLYAPHEHPPPLHVYSNVFVDGSPDKIEPGGLTSATGVGDGILAVLGYDTTTFKVGRLLTDAVLPQNAR